MSDRDLAAKAKEILDRLDIVHRELVEIRLWALQLLGSEQHYGEKIDG